MLRSRVQPRQPPPPPLLLLALALAAFLLPSQRMVVLAREASVAVSGRGAADLTALAGAVASCANATRAPRAAAAGPARRRLPKIALSDVHRTVYLRGVGKTGGTSVLKGLLIPGLCEAHASLNDGSGEKVTLFGGIQVPRGCEEAMARARVFYLAETAATAEAVASFPFVFAFVRAPDERFVSIYDYIVGRARKNAKYAGRWKPSFAEALSNTTTMSDLGASSGHWAPQLPWLVLSGWLSYVSYAGRVETLSSELPSVVELINAAAAAGGPSAPPPKLRMPPASRVKRNVHGKYTCDFDCRAQKEGLSVGEARRMLAASYPMDVAFIQPSAEAVEREEQERRRGGGSPEHGGRGQGGGTWAALRVAPPEATPELMECLLAEAEGRALGRT